MQAFVEEELRKVQAGACKGATFNLTCTTTYKNMKSYLDETPLVCSVRHASILRVYMCWRERKDGTTAGFARAVRKGKFDANIALPAPAALPMLPSG